jgi:hypothetical protein
MRLATMGEEGVEFASGEAETTAMGRARGGNSRGIEDEDEVEDEDKVEDEEE